MIQTEKEAFWYLHLTDNQKEGLALFRKALTLRKLLIAGYDRDDILLRFLKARQWNVEPAVTMYAHMAKWRGDNQVDQLYATLDFPQLPQLVEHYVHFWHKTDKYGRPVYIEMLGKLDCGKMLAVAPQELIMQYHIWTWERMERQLLPACSALKGHPIITATVIIDLAGLSIRNFTLTAQRLMSQITKIDQDYFPEHLGTMFIINAAWVFTTIWAFVNPLLEERTRKKIIVLGADYSSKLKELIPEENLPTFFGGLSKCPDYERSIGPWTDVEPCASTSWVPLGPDKLYLRGAPHTASLAPAKDGAAPDVKACDMNGLHAPSAC